MQDSSERAAVSWGGALRDNPNNGCEEDYVYTCRPDCALWSKCLEYYVIFLASLIINKLKPSFFASSCSVILISSFDANNYMHTCQGCLPIRTH